MVVRLDDGVIVDLNEPLFSITGFRAEDLVGRGSHELLLWPTVAPGLGRAGGLHQLESVVDVPAGFRTRTGELRLGELSVLVIRVEGRRHAVCTLRAGRDPTAAERRAVARLELRRVLRGGGGWQAMAEAAVRVLGECLRWELAAVWQVDREAGVLRCTQCWCAPVGCPEDLASATTRAAVGPGEGPLGRVWEAGEAAWLPDVLADPGFAATRASGAPARVHGWVAMPVPGQGEVLGLLELVSRAVRDRDQDTLDLLEWLAAQLGVVAAGGQADEGDEEAPAGLEPRPDAPVLRELAHSVDRLRRLLEGLAQGDRPEPAGTASGAAGGEGDGLPARLTLKAVSERTGIPAATVRTWERRYRFIQPTRSPSGYRIYGEEDIARILEVKRLLEQGVRINEAMAAVRARPPQPEGG